MEFIINALKNFLYLLPAVVIAMSVHEFSHGYAAYLLGDSTAKEDGRLSLNPLRHMDILGTICLFVFGFGWAKPVMVSTLNFKNPKRDMALTALAGPVSNFICATLFSVILGIMFGIFKTSNSEMVSVAVTLIANIISLNIGLGLFNLIPIPPLDGSKILGLFLPHTYYQKLLSLERYASIFILVIFLFGDFLLRPLSYLNGVIYSFLMNISQYIANIF